VSAPTTTGAPHQDVCAHYWLVERPEGPMSAGRCQVCGAERVFRNSFEGKLWEDDKASGPGSMRRSRSTRWGGVN